MRSAYVERKTKETDIKLKLNLDGGDIKIDTGIGFFDHMLNSFATHGRFGLEVSVKGDLYVDEHHTVEDTGIVLGKAFAEALSTKSQLKDSAVFMFLWTKRLLLRLLTSVADLILYSTLIFRRKDAAATTVQ